MKPSDIVPLHYVWSGLIRRCTNPSVKNFHRYGGRGIAVCERWLGSFDAFVEDMGPRPSPKHEIDRIDNDGPYSPENCRWATKHEQSRNRHTTVRLTFQGRTQCALDWANELGVSYLAIRARVARGWPAEKALSLPAVQRTKNVPKGHLLTAHGQTKHLAEWARDLGCNPAAILARLKTGMSEEEAVTKLIPERPNAKLTMRQARAIRKAYPESTMQSIADRYGVSKKTVLNILHNRIFKEE